MQQRDRLATPVDTARRRKSNAHRNRQEPLIFLETARPGYPGPRLRAAHSEAAHSGDNSAKLAATEARGLIVAQCPEDERPLPEEEARDDGANPAGTEHR